MADLIVSYAVEIQLSRHRLTIASRQASGDLRNRFCAQVRRVAGRELHILVADQEVVTGWTTDGVHRDGHDVASDSGIKIGCQEAGRLIACQANITVSHRTAFTDKEQVNERCSRRMRVRQVDASVLRVTRSRSRSVDVVNQHRTCALIADFRSRRERKSRASRRAIDRQACLNRSCYRIEHRSRCRAIGAIYHTIGDLSHVAHRQSLIGRDRA